MEWHSTKHTNALVPFYAQGAGSRRFKRLARDRDPVRGRYLDNTCIAGVIFSLLEQQDSGKKESSNARGPATANEGKRLPIPRYTVRRTIDSIVIDGKAAEQSWKRAKRVGRFVTWDGEQHADITDCKIVWDEEALYFLFVCRDEDIQASLRQHDDPLWEEDVVEVFIDADADEKTYVELIVNPLNTTFDNYLLRNPRENEQAAIHCWTCAGLTTAVTVEGTVREPRDASRMDADKQWVVEMRIPFSSFVLTAGPSGKPPRDGDVWRMALTRYDRPDPKSLLHLAWSAPYAQGWPHVTRRFGRVVFSSRPLGE